MLGSSPTHPANDKSKSGNEASCFSFLWQNGTQFEEEYNRRINESDLEFVSDPYGQDCYDAMWTLAYALNNTIAGKLMAMMSLSIHTVKRINEQTTDRRYN